MSLRFGYYRADWFNGKRVERLLDEVLDRSDFTYCEAGQQYHGSWAGFRRAMKRARAKGLGIHLNFQEQDALMVLQHARAVWNSVELVDIVDEPKGRKRDVNEEAEALRDAIKADGLDSKPIGAVFGQKEILKGNGWQAPALDWIGIEGYVPHSFQRTVPMAAAECRRIIREQLDVLPRKTQVVVVGQSFDRETWTNIAALAALQDATYSAARMDKRVTHVRWFDYGGQGGTQDHPELAERHRAIFARDRAEED